MRELKPETENKIIAFVFFMAIILCSPVESAKIYLKQLKGGSK